MKISRHSVVVLMMLSVVMFAGCKSNSSVPESEEGRDIPILSEEQLKEQLKETECSSPSGYFEGVLTHMPKYKNALSMKVKALKLDCNIKNNATLATFKDVQFRVVFTSKTGTIILEKDFTVYDFFEPGKTVNYKTEMGIDNQSYKDISDFKWSIVSAACN